MGKVRNWWIKVRVYWISWKAAILLLAYQRANGRPDVQAEAIDAMERNLIKYEALTGTKILKGGNHHG